MYFQMVNSRICKSFGKFLMFSKIYTIYPVLGNELKQKALTFMRNNKIFTVTTHPMFTHHYRHVKMKCLYNLMEKCIARNERYVQIPFLAVVGRIEISRLLASSMCSDSNGRIKIYKFLFTRF